MSVRRPHEVEVYLWRRSAGEPEVLLLPERVEAISEACFAGEVPAGARVELDWEHQQAEWRPLSEAASILRYPAVARAMQAAVTGRG